MALIYLATDLVFQKVVKNWDYDAFPWNTLVTFADNRAPKWREAGRVDQLRLIDSGAFTIHMRGKGQIDLNAYMAEARNSYWDECVALDVIGDGEASRRNAETMRMAGLKKTIPVFHQGEPWEILDEYKRNFRRIGLGGIARARDSVKLVWIEQCFARAWPALFHLFGITSNKILMTVPADTVDSSSWSLRTQMFGSSLRGKIGRYDKTGPGLGGEIIDYRRLQERSEAKWGRILEPLRAELPPELLARRANQWRANAVY
jgi:hypothetical protein